MSDSPSDSRIGFRTATGWTADDVLVLTSSVRDLYNVALTYRIHRDLLARRAEYFTELSETQMRRMRKMGPMLDEMMFAYRDWIKHARSEPGLIPPPFPFGWSIPADQIPVPPVSDLFDNIRQYSSQSQRLRVFKIHIASPGGFSFQGIAEPIKEIRELIKDLWYRNKNENYDSQLDIIDKFLTLQRKHSNVQLPLPPAIAADKKLARSVEESARQIRELEQSGKLLPVPENLDYIPDSDS